MAMNGKNFDDFDDFDDDKLSCGDDSEGQSRSSANSALAWRKPLIERASANIRKALDNKLDLKLSYKTGALVFDEAASKFGRVLESKPGFLNVAYVSGGSFTKRDIEPLDFVKENRANLTLQEMAKEIKLSEVQVIGLLNKIELESDKAPKSAQVNSPTKASAKAKNTNSKKPMAVISSLPSSKKSRGSLEGVKIAAKNTTGSTGAKAKKSKKPEIKVSLETSSVGFTDLLPKGAVTDPIHDPNGYIRQNFLLMNNKELAGATGLSEHTIRRKLGEWGLKRKDFINKT